MSTVDEATGTPDLSLSDEHLVERAQGGDTAAFGELVRRYSDRLYAVVVRITANSEDAEEAVQEAFLRAWRSIGRFERRSKFFTWLYRVGINEARRRVERRPPPGVAGHADEQVVEQIPDERPRPEREIEQRELGGALKKAIRSLSLEYRTPLVLRDVEGFSTAEAAEIMELGEAAFKSRLHRARMAVRKAVEPQLENGGE